MIWDMLNSALRIAVLVLATVAVTRFQASFNLLERIGLSLMGGCGFLTIAVIWELEASPFYGWVPTLFTLGSVLFLAGLLHRKSRHERANQQAAQDAATYLHGRGKL